jgi:hypothetical protein
MEHWKPLFEYPSYTVSDLGNLARVLTYGKSPKAIWKLCAKRIKRGYVQFHLCEGGKIVDAAAHRLVWEAFNGAIPDNLEINHKNGKRSDNRLANLELLTKSQNCIHAFRCNGRPAPNNPTFGSKNGSAKLKETDIPKIFALYDAGFLQRQIAERYGVSQRAISSILRGENWGHLRVPSVTR